MSHIARLYHGTEVVKDGARMSQFYHDVFGSWTYSIFVMPQEKVYTEVTLLGGAFAMAVLEPEDPDSDMPAARFLRKHGNHFFNCGFFAKDLHALAQQVLSSGVRIALLGGKVVDAIPAEGLNFFLPYPRDTFGIAMEFIADNHNRQDFRRQPWFNGSYWRDRHPLGNEGLSHTTFAVTDLENASRYCERGLGVRLVHSSEDRRLQTKSNFFDFGNCLVEVATPTADSSPMATFIRKHGSGNYSYTFKVRNLAAAARHLETWGLKGKQAGSDALQLDGSPLSGIFTFTERAAEGHPIF